jgi:hypothetical protein
MGLVILMLILGNLIGPSKAFTPGITKPKIPIQVTPFELIFYSIGSAATMVIKIFSDQDAVSFNLCKRLNYNFF